MSGHATANDGSAEKCPMIAPAKTTGAAPATIAHCNAMGLPVPAAIRFNMIIAEKNSAATSGRNATAPSSATLGRNTNATPTNAKAEASHAFGCIGSFRNRADASAVNTGLTKTIAVASANGIAKILKKKAMEEPASISPLPNCSHGFSTANAAGPSFTATNTANRGTARVNRSAATAGTGHDPAIDLITASPHESTAKPTAAIKNPLLLRINPYFS